MFHLPSLVLLGFHTFGSPGPQWAVVIYHVVESEGQDEEGAVTGRVHLEGYISLIQTHRLTLFSQRRLQKLTCYLRNPRNWTYDELCIHYIGNEYEIQRYFIRCVYLAAQKEALTHVSNTDHETRSALMIGDHSMLTELHRLTTFLRPCYLHTQNENINALLDLRELYRSQKYILFNQILFQFNPVPVRLHV